MAIGQHPPIQFLMLQRKGEWQRDQAKGGQRLVDWLAWINAWSASFV